MSKNFAELLDHVINKNKIKNNEKFALTLIAFECL